VEELWTAVPRFREIPHRIDQAREVRAHLKGESSRHLDAMPGYRSSSIQRIIGEVANRRADSNKLNKLRGSLFTLKTIGCDSRKSRKQLQQTRRSPKIAPKPSYPPDIESFEAAVREMNRDRSSTAAARDSELSRKQLQDYVTQRRLGKRKGERWVTKDNWVAHWNLGRPYREQIRPFGFLLSFMPRSGVFAPFRDAPIEDCKRGRPPETDNIAPIAPYDSNPQAGTRKGLRSSDWLGFETPPGP
jgi:hypothetical protein